MTRTRRVTRTRGTFFDRPTNVDGTALFNTTSFLDTLDFDTLRSLARHFEWVTVPGGEVLMRQGEPGEDFYLVAAGRLRVEVLGSDGAPRIVQLLGAGDSVGEIALLTRSTRSATVRATRDSVLLRLSREEFDRAIGDSPELVRNLTASLLTRILAQDEGAPDPPTRTIAVVGLGDTDTSGLVRELAEELARSLEVLVLDSARAAAALESGIKPRDDEPRNHPRLVRWLHAQESAHDLVLFEADRGDTAWSECCIRQADRVLIVADADGRPDAGWCRRWLVEDESMRRRDLALLHSVETTAPSGTAEWLEVGAFDGHLHLQLGRGTDVARLGRWLLDESVALVLSGGSARALAHLGVLQGLEQAGVPVDAVGGVSMGAMLGALLARGERVVEIERMAREFTNTKWPFGAPTLPIVSLYDGKRIGEELHRVFGEQRIEDLWLPFFCMSTNLTQGEEEVHASGPLWRWLEASSCVPVAVPPIIHERDLLVDGGVLNNLPVDVMQRRVAGPVVAVDVGTHARAKAPEDGTLPAGWRLLGRKLQGAGKDEGIPSMIDMAYECSTLAGRRAEEEGPRRADLYLRPELEDFRHTAFHRIDEIVALGREHTLESLESCDVPELRRYYDDGT